MAFYPRIRQAAFTLVELSIVLVIIGLITGGVLMGKSLVRAAELRAVATEYARYETALGAFHEKYNALPGDMNNAVSFWGSADGGSTTMIGLEASCNALDYTTPSTDKTTCNGNGDGLIGGTSPTQHEMLRAWQHLANAGLIDGRYTGVPTSDGSQEPGVNIPASRIQFAGWMIYGIGHYAGDDNLFPADYGNTLSYGTLSAGVLTGSEAYNLDKKLDDGSPTTGTLMQYHTAAIPNCLLDDESAYDLANAVQSCIPIFITGY